LPGGPDPSFQIFHEKSFRSKTRCRDGQNRTSRRGTPTLLSPHDQITNRAIPHVGTLHWRGLPGPSESLEQRFEVKIRVLNPNDVDLAGDGVDLILEINDRRLGRAVSSESFLVPRLGDEVIVLVASANWLDMFRQAVALAEARDIEYTLEGRLFLADSPTWLRFQHEGSLLSELLPRDG
jgi:hypothetical protein